MCPLCVLLPRLSGFSVQIQVFKLPSFKNTQIVTIAIEHEGFSASKTRVQPPIINSTAHSLLSFSITTNLFWICVHLIFPANPHHPNPLNDNNLPCCLQRCEHTKQNLTHLDLLSTVVPPFFGRSQRLWQPHQRHGSLGPSITQHTAELVARHHQRHSGLVGTDSSSLDQTLKGWSVKPG